MRRAVMFAGLALAVSLAAPSVVSASDEALTDGLRAWPSAGSLISQRKDVEEVSLPPPPSGPATPVPYCTPAQTVCP